METTSRGQVKKLTMAHKSNIAKSMIGYRQTPEHIHNHALAVRGRPNSKVSEALRGKAKTEAHKESIRKTQLERKEALRSYEIGYKKDEKETPFFGFFSEYDY